MQNYNEIVPEAFSCIEKIEDSFQIVSHIKSHLLYGDISLSQHPWLSVVIPTNNRDDVLLKAINSARNQSPTDFQWELIVVDNTPLDSNNSTPALYILQKLEDKRILYYHNEENIGPGYNWNRGVELARGEWVCFLHDDDVLCTDALAQIGRLLRHGRKSGQNLGYLNARRLDFKGDFGVHSSTEFGRFPQELFTTFGMLVCGHTGVGAPTCGTTILKKAYMETGGINYDFGVSADAVLSYLIMKRYAVVSSDCILGGYRWSDNATLSPSSLLNFIRSDDLIMRYLYGQNQFVKYWGKLFGDAISWRNIWRKNNTAMENQVSISYEDFASVSLFSEPRSSKKHLYLLIYAAFRLYRYISGYFFRFISRKSR